MVAPPVPIPNTEVKRHSAHDTAPARVWENRSLPGDYLLETLHLKMGRLSLSVMDLACLLALADERDWVFFGLSLGAATQR